MDKWKTIALVLGGFSGGMVYMTACGDKGSSPMDAHAGEDDTADDGSGGGGTAPPAGGEGAGRAVVNLYTDANTRCLPVVTWTSGSASSFWVDQAIVEQADAQQLRDNDEASAWVPWTAATGTRYRVGGPEYPPTVASPACSCPSGFSFVGWHDSNKVVCLED